MIWSLALAGLAETALWIEIWLNWLAFGVMTILLIWGFLRSSRIAALSVSIVCSLYLLLFQPWMYFQPADPYYVLPDQPPQIDLDVVYWNERFLDLAYIAVPLSIVLTFLTLALLFRLKTSQTTESEGLTP